MKILAIIPARGGSKRVKRKNIRKINNKPLIAYTIEAAQKSKKISRIVVSTDDLEIAKVSEEFGIKVPFMRPPEFSTDRSNSADLVLHSLEECRRIYNEEYDYIVLLQPTSPFRTSFHIEEAIKMLVNNPNADSLISVNESGHFHPEYLYFSNDEILFRPLIENREIKSYQEMKKSYIRNGAIYIVKRTYFEKNKSLISKNNLAIQLDEHSSINIDTEIDLQFANYIAIEKLLKL
jgi:CMP-N,N'-diacetyllegionaminic acid synthase